VKEAFMDPKLVAMNLIITGLFLFLTRLAKPVEQKKVGGLFALTVGIAQALAILPGISRSGTTMSTAMYLRMPAVRAARFSFLLSIPVIAGASLLETGRFMQQAAEVGFAPIAAGTLVSAITGYLAIKILLRIMEKGKFSFFSIYCFALGIFGLLFID
jgi:undecaprenyl-diphosphatase